MGKNLYIVRHGETEYNRLGIIQGSGVDSSLNDTGRLQAELFYNNYKGKNFDFVYTSALRRTYESVERFIETDNITHRSLAELNEISWGQLENAKPDADWKVHYTETINAWKSGNLERGIAGGENPLQVQARLLRAVADINSNTASNILLCMHGRALKIMLCTIIGKPLTEMEDFSHSNLCMYHLVNEGPGWEIKISNSVSHLVRPSV